VGKNADEAHGPVAAAGVGLPGVFDATAGTVTFLPNLPGAWRGVAVVGPLSDALGLRVELVNDARAFTLGEWQLGAARGCSDAAFLVVGTGVGGGLVVNGRLHLGFDGTAGELGHQTVDPEGPACGCGSRGCVEAIACAAAIAGAAGVDSVPAAAAAAAAGDGRARAAFDRAGRALGIAFANVVLALAPERLVLGGGVAEAGALLLDPLRDELDRRVRLKDFRTPVALGELGRTAGAIGAAVRARTS
jgi:glucokinase